MGQHQQVVQLVRAGVAEEQAPLAEEPDGVLVLVDATEPKRMVSFNSERRVSMALLALKSAGAFATIVKIWA